MVKRPGCPLGRNARICTSGSDYSCLPGDVYKSQPQTETVAETSTEEKTPKKRGRKPGSKKVTAKTEEQQATETKETAKEEVKAEAPAKPTPKKAKKEETPAIPEEKEVILPELEFGSETDDFIPIEDLPSEKIELPTELLDVYKRQEWESLLSRYLRGG